MVDGPIIPACRARNLSPRTMEQYDWSIGGFRLSLETDRAGQVLADLGPESVPPW